MRIAVVGSPAFDLGRLFPAPDTPSRSPAAAMPRRWPTPPNRLGRTPEPPAFPTRSRTPTSSWPPHSTGSRTLRRRPARCSTGRSS